jgi:adenine-specific DNA-methyltransferase
MSTKTKLELTWIGKENRPRLEPRILIEDQRFSYHAAVRRSDSLFQNSLIRGDNLLALRALESEFVGQIDCIYIDPPYNTGSAFKHYDDGVEHSLWLSLMRDRLTILANLLRPSGHIFCQADDHEAHYLKIVMDEVFGRSNFITNFIWRKVDSPNDNKVAVTPDHEFIFCYAKDAAHSKLRPKSDPELAKAYGQVADDGRRYRDRLLKKNGASSLREDRPSMFYPIPGPDHEDVYPVHDDGREARWSLGKDAALALAAEDKLVWKRRFVFDRERWVPYTREWAPENPTRPYPTIWADVHTMRQAKSHQKDLFGAENVFSTPKPENLIQRILEMATNPEDLVLDSFAGSGTTGAVAHKMGRRWIMVELGDHCETHVVPRLKKVIDGEDPGGITEAVGWKGGGGYRYFKLAPSLLEKDQFGNWVISKSYNAEMLAEAMCKHFGFAYAPSAEHYWMHGHSSETDFIYVTTNSLTHEQLVAISDEVGPERTLLICCKAFQGGNADAFGNLTIRKIPGAILDRCEWGKDDYSLKIEALPLIEDEPEEAADEAPRRKSADNPNQPGLFNGDEETGA